MRPVRDALRAALVFLLLTLLMTWPQVRDLQTHVAAHFDSYFSMWRVSWVAHQLLEAPTRLFEGNIFHPQRLTLALSDPVLMQGLVAAPLIWAGVSTVTAYNLLILASFVLAGVAAWALATRLTGSAPAGYLAGIVFAFAPYRFEHFFHLEILWSFWIPLTFLVLHRAVDRGSFVDGVRTGVMVIAQALSCLYYAVYLGISLTIAGPLLVRWRGRDRSSVVAGLALGAVAAVLCTVMYLQPLLAIRDEVVPRVAAEAGVYSARLSSYLATPGGNWLYGDLTSGIGGPELRLFPGLAAIVLAIGALLRPRRITLVYFVLLVVAVVASMGVNAPFFRMMRGASELVTMLRVPARFAAVMLCALSVLAALGAASLLSSLATRRARAIAVCAFGVVMIAEYRTALELQEVPPPALVYQWLASQPTGPVAELPMPRPDGLPGYDAHREYYSTFHWHPLLNGYSGYYPRSHQALLHYMTGFPRGQWIELLLGRGARYIVIHERELPRQVVVDVLQRLDANPRVRPAGRFPDPLDPAYVYERSGTPRASAP